MACSRLDVRERWVEPQARLLLHARLDEEVKCRHLYRPRPSERAACGSPRRSTSRSRGAVRSLTNESALCYHSTSAYR